MVMCFAPDCKHYSERKTCRFFVFPKDPTEKKKWISLLRRKDREPSAHSLVCSCHFVDGDRRNGPTIFEHNKLKRFIDQPSTSTAKPKKLKKPIQAVDSHPPGGIEPEIEENVQPSTSHTLTSSEMSPRPGTSRKSMSPPSSGTSHSSSTPGLSQSGAKQLPLVATLEAENYFLKKELQEAQENANRLASRFSFSHIENSNEKILLFTGLPSKEIFKCLFNLMDSCTLKYYHGWSVVSVPKIDQLLLTLMKLKLNLVNEDLALRFNISSKTVANIFYTWLYALHEILFKKFMQTIPSRNKNKLCMPTCFNNFTNCRIILDCTEIYCVQPGNMDKQRATYSSYKHRNTLKGLIGVAPNGVITFASKLYPGSVSDKKIVRHCGILDQMEAGDLIIADKGFLISDLLPPGVSLNIPPFLTTAQFTPQQVVQTRTIARARIHVERAIRRIKCYKILSLVPAYLTPHASFVYQVCAALTNFQFPLIREVEDLFSSGEESE